ncbi:phenylalanine 4-monooxygenase [Paraglaciecola hydrolytica]|uniref:Phenylalanine-4-hydroxylase n=1 Tax=Paraglaciecola hydrolytica TaxID=1799789 RepID=A0A148KNT3_9ALTE|nr:phenylalanine 4-monooxygenase [Paraglaciecola hydrolytica]KXI27974.1 phenylalanine 4-monooxygenase [Paraglaciecola hydrolytica]
MSKHTKYISNQADQDGTIHWSTTENATWRALVKKQLSLLPGRACDEYLNGLKLLDLTSGNIPQLRDINGVLKHCTGWQVTQVPSLINFDRFFNLLANKEFPVATFIRSPDEFEYLQEPDIFHEIFGHCPLLTNPAFAHFTHTYGLLGQQASKEDRAYLARLYWFTVEFGLLKTPTGVRIYGGGILSSPGETIHALDTQACEHFNMQVIEALRTPYRIDIMQPVYYLLDSFEQLFEIADLDLMALVQQAKALGLHPPKYEAKQSLAS